MVESYDALARVVTDAGFFTNGVEDHGTWHRTCVGSESLPGHGLTGNSFWVSRGRSGWYLGAWGGSLYRLPDEERLAELCISWLSRVPAELCPDFDDRVKKEFGLVPVSNATFRSEAGFV